MTDMAKALAPYLIGLVALLQLAICVAEIFFWRLPKVHKRLEFNQADADRVAPIVANAGLYNGFLAAGLVWSLTGPGDLLLLRMFFLSCVTIAGCFGAYTLRPTTLLIQTAPAAFALAIVWASRGGV